LANPFAQDKTVVIGNNDGGTGIMNNSVVLYVGTKTNSGSEVDKAGLTNGSVSFINVTGNPLEIVNTNTRATNIVNGTAFTLSSTASTAFSRPEDGCWNPANLSQYFFVTTDRIDQVADGVGTEIGRSRLWRLNFTDITNPNLGGTIDLLLNGTEGQNMFDNLVADKNGHLILLEDVGNNSHNGKVWQYTIATNQLKMLAKHDPARFGDIGLAATAPFNTDEETSGVIDMSNILGDGNFLLVDQAHYTSDTEAVEGG
jgi:secreted PhoX family phosphatase